MAICIMHKGNHISEKSDYRKMLDTGFVKNPNSKVVNTVEKMRALLAEMNAREQEEVKAS